MIVHPHQLRVIVLAASASVALATYYGLYLAVRALLG